MMVLLQHGYVESCPITRVWFATYGGIITFLAVMSPWLVALVALLSASFFVENKFRDDPFLVNLALWIFVVFFVVVTLYIPVLQNFYNGIQNGGLLNPSSSLLGDFAIATVVVAPVVPKLPNTGLSPDEQSIPWKNLMTFGIPALVLMSLFVVLRKKTI